MLYKKEGTRKQDTQLGPACAFVLLGRSLDVWMRADEDVPITPWDCTLGKLPNTIPNKPQMTRCYLGTGR